MDMLGERIALLRRGKGWSQMELAQQLHISASAVGMYEQGRREPSLEGIVELAAVFGVSADYLLTGRALTPADENALSNLLPGRLSGGSQRRRTGGFSREELQLLLAAMLQET
jgi:transcriptional regulator with XRE-family HTH domain